MSAPPQIFLDDRTEGEECFYMGKWKMPFTASVLLFAFIYFFHLYVASTLPEYKVNLWCKAF